MRVYITPPPESVTRNMPLGPSMAMSYSPPPPLIVPTVKRCVMPDTFVPRPTRELA